MLLGSKQTGAGYAIDRFVLERSSLNCYLVLFDRIVLHWECSLNNGSPRDMQNKGLCDAEVRGSLFCTHVCGSISRCVLLLKCKPTARQQRTRQPRRNNNNRNQSNLLATSDYSPGIAGRQLTNLAFVNRDCITRCSPFLETPETFACFPNIISWRISPPALLCSAYNHFSPPSVYLFYHLFCSFPPFISSSSCCLTLHSCSWPADDPAHNITATAKTACYHSKHTHQNNIISSFTLNMSKIWDYILLSAFFFCIRKIYLQIFLSLVYVCMFLTIK